jgi:hypothetical protein
MVADELFCSGRTSSSADAGSPRCLIQLVDLVEDEDRILTGGRRPWMT